jgi:hypothetical protein
MTRPAVIVGLGGTGQWVLTYLKKDLLELNNGTMPPNVRLLAFDTVSQAEAQKQVSVGLYTGEQAAYEKAVKRIGTVELERDTELIHLGGDCYPLAEDIEKGQYPYLNWFDVGYWKYKAGLTRDNWILDRGAGRWRQFGLLAVHKDLLGGPVRSEILKRLPAAISEVLETVEDSTSFEVIVVSSVAGGTGSAMLVPFGVLARKMCGDKPVRTRAIVVLPTAFSPGRPSAELELRGGAALRELARAMMPPEDYVAHITLLPGHREYESVAYTRPFDGIYFIDGMRGGQPINNDPKYGVFPAAAMWIRQILDDQSGMWFTNFVATNRAGAQASDPKRLAEGVFGVFGAHSFYAPERTLRQTYRLKLADRLLRELTEPRPEGPGGRLTPNPLPRGAAEPAPLALTFLQQTAIFGEEQQPVTSLFSEIGRIVQAGGKANGDEVRQKAEAGWAAKRQREREAYSWLTSLATLPAGARFDAVRQDVERELGANFYKRFPPSDASTPPRDPGSNAVYVDLTDNVDAFIREHHGGMGADGPDDYGSFGAIARLCAEEQVGVWHNMLRLRLLSLLSEERGRGRLGYAIRVLDSLEKHLEEFQEFMKEVEKRRGQLAPRVDLERKVESTKVAWQRLRREPPSLLERIQRKPSSKAIQAEKSYLGARADLINYVREETLHNAVKTATAAMRSYCAETRHELERWAVALLEGDKALDIYGLLAEVKNELDRITTTIREDQRSEQVEKLVQVATRESKIADVDVQWALEGLRWLAEDVGTSLRLTLDMKPQGVVGGSLQVAREGSSTAARRQVERHNLSTLGRVMEQRFGQVEQVTNVLEWCQNHETYSDPMVLADELSQATQPLTALRVGAQPGIEAFSVSLKHDVDPMDYAGRLERQVRLKLTGAEKPDNNHPVEVIGSEDPYRLTAVRTQVGLMLEEFRTWQQCQDAYETELKKADGATPERIRELIRTQQSQYTQWEEKEAIALEAQWRSEGLAHRVLNPRMVSLVGKQRELQTALQCWVLGWVQEVADKEFVDRYHWELKVPTWAYEFWLTPNKTRGAIGPFEAMEAFVLVGRNHARSREGAALNWIDLNQTLVIQRQAAEGRPSALHKAVEAALAEGGLISQWTQRAGRYVDPHTDKESFRNPAYRDLADYAARYFKSVEW